MTKNIVLKATGIVKELGEGAGKVTALKGVNFSLLSGELTLLMGPSGSGKTTLLSILGCIMRQTSGTLTVDEHCTTGLKPDELAKIRREHIGFVFQSYNLFPTLTAQENVQLPLDVQDCGRHEAQERAAETLERVGLAHKLKSFPRHLSGGEQQRVAIARALVSRPTLILADEPTAALDGKNGQAIMGLLSDIAASNDSAVLAVTHDPRTEPFADRIVRIEDGQIQSSKEKRKPNRSRNTNGRSKNGADPELQNAAIAEAELKKPRRRTRRRSR